MKQQDIQKQTGQKRQREMILKYFGRNKAIETYLEACQTNYGAIGSWPASNRQTPVIANIDPKIALENTSFVLTVTLQTSTKVNSATLINTNNNQISLSGSYPIQGQSCQFNVTSISYGRYTILLDTTDGAVYSSSPNVLDVLDSVALTTTDVNAGNLFPIEIQNVNYPAEYSYRLNSESIIPSAMNNGIVNFNARSLAVGTYSVSFIDTLGRSNTAGNIVSHAWTISSFSPSSITGEVGSTVVVTLSAVTSVTSVSLINSNQQSVSITANYPITSNNLSLNIPILPIDVYTIAITDSASDIVLSANKLSVIGVSFLSLSPSVIQPLTNTQATVVFSSTVTLTTGKLTLKSSPFTETNLSGLPLSFISISLNLTLPAVPIGLYTLSFNTSANNTLTFAQDVNATPTTIQSVSAITGTGEVTTSETITLSKSITVNSGIVKNTSTNITYALTGSFPITGSSISCVIPVIPIGTYEFILTDAANTQVTGSTTFTATGISISSVSPNPIGSASGSLQITFSAQITTISSATLILTSPSTTVVLTSFTSNSAVITASYSAISVDGNYNLSVTSASGNVYTLSNAVNVSLALQYPNIYAYSADGTTPTNPTTVTLYGINTSYLTKLSHQLLTIPYRLKLSTYTQDVNSNFLITNTPTGDGSTVGLNGMQPSLLWLNANNLYITTSGGSSQFYSMLNGVSRSVNNTSGNPDTIIVEELTPGSIKMYCNGLLGFDGSTVSTSVYPSNFWPNNNRYFGFSVNSPSNGTTWTMIA